MPWIFAWRNKRNRGAGLRAAQGSQLPKSGVENVQVANLSRNKPATARNARTLRGQLTDAERSLWPHLRRRPLEGLKFRRQHPIGWYIADFVCLEARLVIEVETFRVGNLRHHVLTWPSSTDVGYVEDGTINDTEPH